MRSPFPKERSTIISTPNRPCSSHWSNAGGEQLEQRVLPIIQDPKLSALDKLLRYFATHDHFKRERTPLVFAFLRAWYADENAIVRHKLHTTQARRLVPWLSQIIREGVEEGVFTTSYPDQAARMIVALLARIIHMACQAAASMAQRD